MARFAWCVAALAALARAALGEDVITLGGSNFTDAVKQHDKLIVEFYAPWCGHCKKLAPELEKAAGELKAEGIVIAKVDATEDENKELSSKYGVRGFPTLKIFRGDAEAAQEYEGPRDAAGIQSHLRLQFGPAATEIADAAAMEAAKKPEDGEVIVVAVLPGGEGSEAHKEFLAAAEALRGDALFKITTDGKLEPEAGGKEAVFVYKTFDEPSIKLDGEFKKDVIVAFVEKASTPRLVSLDRSKANTKRLQTMFADQKVPKLIGAMPADGDAATLTAFKEELIKISEANEGKLHVIYLNPAENEGAMKFFGVEKKETPCLLVHEPTGNSKYASGALEIAKMSAWTADYLAGKIEKKIKSEEPPADNDGPVKVVTAKTFDELVFSGKDVLIEFYAPWCGHCKKLAPIFDELGEFYKNESGLTIAKMDATANDVPSEKFEVQGFPTLMFVSKDGTVSKYSGGRELKDFQAFLADKAGVPGAPSEEQKPAEDEAKKDEL